MAAKKAPAKKAPAKKAPAEKETAAPVAKERDNLPLMGDLSLTVTMELGRTYKTIEDALDIGEQSLIELDKQVGDPIDVLVNGKLMARGEVVTVGENFGVRITEIFEGE